MPYIYGKYNTSEIVLSSLNIFIYICVVLSKHFPMQGNLTIMVLIIWTSDAQFWTKGEKVSKNISFR